MHSDDPAWKKASSVALGVWVGLSPFWGFQTVLVLFLAVVLRLNKLIAFAFSNVSIPPLIPFIIYACLLIGTALLGTHADYAFRWQEIDTYRPFIQQHLKEYVLGSMVLATTSAGVLGLASYFMLTWQHRRKPSA